MLARPSDLERVAGVPLPFGKVPGAFFDILAPLLNHSFFFFFFCAPGYLGLVWALCLGLTEEAGQL